MPALWITGTLICVLLLWRNYLAGVWGLRASREARDLNYADIEAGTYVDGRWRYDLIPSHEALMFDLTLWRYRSPFKG